MSLDAIMSVWDSEEPSSPTDRAVLLALARHADMDGERIFPSIDRIVRMTGLSRSTVTTARRRLLEQGFVEETGKHARGMTEFRIVGVREPDVGVQEPDGEGPAAGPERSLKGQEGGESVTPPTPHERVWAYYQQVFGKRIRPLPSEERKLIAEALRAVDGREEDLIAAIDGNRASAWHQGDNPQQAKYNRLSNILRGTRGGGPHGAKPRTTLETIEMFIERAAESTAGSSASTAQISAAKRAVLDGITYPGDEHVAKRGEEAVAWLASEVGIRWDEQARKWVPTSAGGPIS